MKKLSLAKIAFLQALGVVTYISLVSILFWKGNDWFPKMDAYLGPILMLTILSVSVVICGLIVFSYPVTLFWEKKKTKKALKLVALTAMWLMVFVLGLFIALL